MTVLITAIKTVSSVLMEMSAISMTFGSVNGMGPNVGSRETT
ncbi:hypothetical protein ACFMBG_23750 [Leisingera sp. D0M16]